MDELQFLLDCDANPSQGLTAYEASLKTSMGFLMYTANPSIPLETPRVVFNSACTEDALSRNEYDG